MQSPDISFTYDNTFFRHNSLTEDNTIKVGVLKKSVEESKDMEKPKLPASLSYLWDQSADIQQACSLELSDYWNTMDTGELYEKFEFDLYEENEVSTSQTAIKNNVNTFSELEYMKEELNELENERDIISRKGFCGCQKSKCLKLYCECFALQQYCVNCNCIECHNIPKYYKEKKAATVKVRAKDPLGFFRRAGMEKGLMGCNCSKSKCQRNYCPCYKSGIKCTEQCKCFQCNNCTPSLSV